MKTRLVAVGGGTAGTGELDPAKFELVLITEHPTYVYLPAVLRLLVKKGTPMDSVFMPYDKLFGTFPGVLVVGTVKTIEQKADDGSKGTLTLADNTQYPYDVLLVATGSSWEDFLSLPTDTLASEAHVEAWQTKIQNAENIVIAGGGAVGSETAGEIMDAWPNKSVTIVHNKNLLINSVYPDKFRLKVEQKLKKRGVKIILEDSIDVSAAPLNGKITTHKGIELECDLLIPVRGGKPNAAFMSSLEPNPLDEKGYVKVTRTLQVESHESIFAAGDIINWPEVKQFAKISAAHIPVVTDNILAFLHRRSLPKRYNGFWDLLVLTNGQNGGVTYFGLLWGLIFGDFVTRILKSKDLLVPKQRKELGLA